MNFGEAIEELKRGVRVYRKGWNSKGMWLVLMHADRRLPTLHGFAIQPCIAMKTAGDEMQPGWLASQADMLAEDWCVVAGDD